MASATIIDQLIVKLGLDPSGFTKGQKVAAAEVVKTEKQVKKSSGEMSSSIAGFTKKLLGVATAAVIIRKTLGYVSDLSTSVRQLGIDSRNFNIAASELKNFQNVSEMFGGKGEEVTRTIGNITKAVYDLAYNGQISDSLIMLARLGVEFQDTAGNAKDFKDIVMDAQKSIQQQMGSGSLSRANANQMLLQAGFDPGLTQAILEGKAGQELAHQQGRRQVTGAIVGKATEWEKSATNRDQAIEAATLRVLPTQADAGIKANNAIAGAAEGLSDSTLSGSFDSIYQALTEGGKKIEEGVENMVNALGRVAARGPMTQGMIERQKQSHEEFINLAADKFGINPRLIKGIIQTESSWNPNAEARDKDGNVTGKGLMGLNPKYNHLAGVSADQDIVEGTRNLFNIYNHLEKKGFKGNDLLTKSLQAYNAGETRLLESLQPGGKPLSQQTLDYPGKVLGYANQAVPTPAAQTPNTNQSAVTNIDTININTRATDADGIAGDMSEAATRKFNAAQAERGTQ